MQLSLKLLSQGSQPNLKICLNELKNEIYACDCGLFNSSLFYQNLVKKLLIEILQNSQENTCARVSFSVKKETLTQMLSCEFCEISKNTFFTKQVRTTASCTNRFFLKKLNDFQCISILRISWRRRKNFKFSPSKYLWKLSKIKHIGIKLK